MKLTQLAFQVQADTFLFLQKESFGMIPRGPPCGKDWLRVNGGCGRGMAVDGDGDESRNGSEEAPRGTGAQGDGG